MQSTQYDIERSTQAVRQRGSLLQRRGPLLLGVGAALATMAIAVRYKTRQAESENPPIGQFMYVDGVRLHYVDRGQGQPIVLLHGNGTMAQELEISGLLDLASEKYRVIAFDRPGYGYSERSRDKVWTPKAQAELLRHALELLDIEKPIVVGHSWGTMVAVALALEIPEYVRSLVLLSGYYYPTARLDVPLLSPPAIPVIGDLMRYTISPLLGRMIWPAMVRKLFSPSTVTERFSRLFPVWMALRPEQLRASASETAMMIPAAAVLRKQYAGLTMPVVIAAGADDQHVNAHRHSERLHKELPQSELMLVPGVGHMIHHTAPDKAMAAIDRAAKAIEPLHIAEHPVQAARPH